MISGPSTRLIVIAVLTAWAVSADAQDAHNGLLDRNGTPLFPIGFYELPGDPAALDAMAAAGVNLVRCSNPDDLDRVHAAGMLGWMPLPLHDGATDALRAQVEAAAGHPALAVWEGPDEIAWNFTAYSGLFKNGTHKSAGAWWRQEPEAVAYAEEQAASIIPNIHAACELIRAMDPRKRPIWINEAQRTDVFYVRQYLDAIDITGCDIYPVSENGRKIENIGGTTKRWLDTGRGKPVWMVLQGFSWNELGDDRPETTTVYPTFAESRFMAYDAIARGASGVLYWGSMYLKSGAFRESLYAVTSELAALQPFLTAPAVPGARVSVIGLPEESDTHRVQATVRKAGEDWLAIVVNEDDEPHMGTVIEGLGELEGRTLQLLYADSAAPVTHGELILRLQPKDVRVYCTSRAFESPRREGRDFVE